MRKEILYAILAGGLFGLIIAFGIWKANSSIKPRGAQDLQTPQEEQINQNKDVESNGEITLAKPKENQTVLTEKTTISGITKPENYIVISNEEEDYFLTADGNGAFEQEIELMSGLNKITISSIDNDGKTSKKELLLVYSPKFEEQSSTEGDSTKDENNKTSSSSPIREIVQKKIDMARKTPMFYTGTVTDISEETIQIKEYVLDSNSSKSGEIKQIAINNTTNYVNIGKKTKSIKFSDIAIGDFIVAMGYKNENQVLETSRLLVIQTPTFPNLNAFMATLESSTSRKIKANIQPDNKSIELKIDKNTGIFEENDKEVELERDDLEKGDKLIIVKVKNDSSESARTIFVLGKNLQETATPSPTPKASD